LDILSEVPEGDSLHRAAIRLQPLVGHLVTATSPHPRGQATGVARVVDGRRLESVEAVGKHLLLRFEGGVTVRSHLRMTGRWRVGRVGAQRIGRPWLVLEAGGIEATQWNGPVLTLEQRPVRRLGPDLLAPGTEPEALVARFRRTDPGRPLGEALQDQRLVAGIGNMWMSEALWTARISPWRPLGEVGDNELLAALGWARTAMLASVAGSRGGRLVYRRAGRPCPRCGTPIESGGQGDSNRTAYWCPRCQPFP
jgi:endonuclease-8